MHKNSNLENKDKIVKRSKEYYQINKDKINARTSANYYKDKSAYRNRRLKYKFGITLEQYNEMLLKQNKVCVLCKLPESIIDKRSKSIKDLAVDHCHKTGKIRGLLCQRCNLLIGFYENHHEKFPLFIDYLKGLK